MAWTEQTGKHAWRVRYPTNEGHIASVSGFTSQKTADDYAAEIKTDQRRQIWIDPTLGRISVEEDWATRWLPTLDIDLRTFGNYNGNLRNHILPPLGSTSLAKLSTFDITGWIKKLGTEYAPTTVSSIVKLMSVMLEDAVDERIIPTNPIRRRRRRGRRAAKRQPEKIWATPEEVIRIAAQASSIAGDTVGTLIITAAWTGCRWGELVGLHRTNPHLDTGSLFVDPDVGALHEYSRKRWLGPPKTPASARSISLPPFLITLLHQHLERHDNEYVFTNSRGNWLWHSDVTRRGLRPATDGNFDLANPRIRTYPIRPGLTFHGLRHSHKTWLIASAVPEIAQCRRLATTSTTESPRSTHTWHPKSNNDSSTHYNNAGKARPRNAARTRCHPPLHAMEIKSHNEPGCPSHRRRDGHTAEPNARKGSVLVIGRRGRHPE